MRGRRCAIVERRRNAPTAGRPWMRCQWGPAPALCSARRCLLRASCGSWGWKAGFLFFTTWREIVHSSNTRFHPKDTAAATVRVLPLVDTAVYTIAGVYTIQL